MFQEIIFTVITIISVGAGLWAILLINRLYKTFGLNYLNTYLYYQILVFVFGLYGLIGLVLVDELLKTIEAPAKMVESILNFLPYLGVPFIITAWYMFVKLSIEIVGKQISTISTGVYFLLMLLLFLGSGAVVFFEYDSSNPLIHDLLVNTKFLFVIAQAITFAIALYFLYLKGTRVKEKVTRAKIIGFANINLLLKTLLMLLFFLSSRNNYTGLIYLFFFFAGDLPAVLFLYNYLSRNYSVSNAKVLNQSVESFISDYNISPREWEIVEHICKGLTNQQISEKLFISLQTVKDHAHNIYKKTGVKNRVQLVNLISSINSNNLKEHV